MGIRTVAGSAIEVRYWLPDETSVKTPGRQLPDTYLLECYIFASLQYEPIAEDPEVAFGRVRTLGGHWPCLKCTN